MSQCREKAAKASRALSGKTPVHEPDIVVTV